MSLKLNNRTYSPRHGTHLIEHASKKRSSNEEIENKMSGSYAVLEIATHKTVNTVESPNKGHFGTSYFVLC